ncbi:MAG: cation-translocating P-type ATPase [Erysipelotrichaceae bacterium]
MRYEEMTTQQVVEATASTPLGLNDAVAKQRLLAQGENVLDKAKKNPLWRRFVNQLLDPMIIVLIAAALISALTSAYNEEGFADVIIISVVVLVNALLGVLQESKAEAAIEALQKMSAATSKVIRNGSQQTIASSQLVIGDWVVLEAGDAVPADGRIVECASLRLEEAALTGESIPAEKSSDPMMLEEDSLVLGDRTNMAFMGTSAVYGRGKMIVTHTGMHTEMGKIAKALAIAQLEKTPLQQKLAHLSKILTFGVIGISLFIFVFQWIREGSMQFDFLLDTFLIAVSLAVAAIPEGLASVVTIVLSIGVTRMSKHHAIIRKLTAVETLGCAQVICTDKTGTLTQNKMQVEAMATYNQTQLLNAIALCNDACVDQNGVVVGEPTEVALMEHALRQQGEGDYVLKQWPRIQEIPFDSNRKMMSTFHETPEGIIMFSKGALDSILKSCRFIQLEEGIEPLTAQHRIRIEQEHKAMANQALRVLGAAYKPYEQLAQDGSNLECDAIYVGLVGMMDPIRPEVYQAIIESQQAGIKTIMITGDHKDTAIAIASKLGILKDASQAISGVELDAMGEAFDEHYQNYTVYARVMPDHKLNIVNTWRKHGYVCAMSGDGVNDAMSIKKADIGVGMGISGTDVTKNVADMVLADDNFATIIVAISQGRRIYENIRKAIRYLLASNLSEVLSIFIATLLGFTILKPAQLLWINLITDTFPALALGMEPAEAKIMHKPPRNPKESIFAQGLGSAILIEGTLVTLITIAAYFIGHYLESGVWEIVNSPDGVTMAFLTMSMAEIFHSFNLRSLEGSIFALRHQNGYLWAAMGLSLVLTSMVIFYEPIRHLFGFEPISILEYSISMGLALAMIPMVETSKAIRRFIRNRNAN